VWRISKTLNAITRRRVIRPRVTRRQVKITAFASFQRQKATSFFALTRMLWSFFRFSRPTKAACPAGLSMAAYGPLGRRASLASRQVARHEPESALEDKNGARRDKCSGNNGGAASSVATGVIGSGSGAGSDTVEGAGDEGASQSFCKGASQGFLHCGAVGGFRRCLPFLHLAAPAH